MNTNHLSAWEQEEYILDERTPQMLRHLSECAECRAAVARLEDGLGVYRKAAVEWSARRAVFHQLLFNVGALSLASLGATANG